MVGVLTKLMSEILVKITEASVGPAGRRPRSCISQLSAYILFDIMKWTNKYRSIISDHYLLVITNDSVGLTAPYCLPNGRLSLTKWAPGDSVGEWRKLRRLEAHSHSPKPKQKQSKIG